MKRIFLIIAFVLFIPSIYACSYSTKSNQRILASNVNFNVDYRIVNDEAMFKVTITGINKDLYVSFGNNKYYGKDSDTVVIDNLKAGSKNKFDVYSDTYDFCLFGSLNSRTINMPIYNKYYKDKLCLNHQNSDLCYRWNNVNMTYDEFKKTVSKLNTDAVIVPDEPVKRNGISNYLLIIVFGFILTTSGTIILVRRKNVGF